MGFLAPWMLWGVAAASLPVILHFFYRSRYRTVPWAAMKFLLTSIEQTSRRLRFQELLLLVARTALLALLALALARPSSLSSKGSDSDAVDAVLVFDVSFSMGAREGAVTRLDRARQAALAVVDHLPPHSTAQVVTVADRATHLGPPAASNLEHVREVVRSVEMSHLASDLLPGVVEAARALKRGHSANKEVYFFTDLQRRAWEQQSAALVAKLKELKEESAIYLVRCGTRAPRNVSLVGIASQSGIPHTGERIGFAVLVRNSGNETVRDLTVTLEVDGRAREKETQALSQLAPGETVAVTLTAKLDRPGLRIVTAAVGPDELEADNRLSQVLHVREQARALVVDGASSELKPENSTTFYLMHTLRPVPESGWGSYHLQPRAVTPLEAAPALLGDMDLCILANVPVQAAGENSPSALSPDFVERLAAFVREGKGLLVFAGPRTSPDLYNRALWDEQRLLPLRLGAVQGAAGTGSFHPDPNSIEAQSFLAGFREEPLSRLDQANVLQRISVEERDAADAKVVLRYSDGNPAILTRKVGAGTVMFVTTSADLRWTDWPLRHTYLPFVHVALSHLLGGQTESHNGIAGDPLRYRVPADDASKVFAAIDPESRRTRIGVAEVVDGQPIVTASQTPRAGVYRIVAESSDVSKVEEGVPFAAAPDLRESEDLEALGDKQIDERLGFKPHHLTAGEDLGAFSGTERLKREWTLWVLLAVLLIVLFETGLAWYCGRGW